MPGFSDAQEKMLLEAYFAGGAFQAAGTLHIALCTAAPTDDSDVIAEVAYTGYARVQMSVSDWDAITTGTDPTYIANKNVMEFETCPTDSGLTATHFALMSATTGGVMKFSGVIVQPGAGLYLGAGVKPQFDAGALRAQLGG